MTPAKWNPATPLLGSLDDEAGITSNRPWAIVESLFVTATDVLTEKKPAPGQLGQAGLWIQHFHQLHQLHVPWPALTANHRGQGLRRGTMATTSV